MRYINLLLTLTSIHFTLTDDGRFYHVLFTFFFSRSLSTSVPKTSSIRLSASTQCRQTARGATQHVYRTNVVSRPQKLLVDTKGQLRISPAARAKRRLDYGRLGTDMTLMLLQPCHLRPR